MTKHIILIERINLESKLTDFILKKTNFIIELLVVPDNKCKEKHKNNPRIKKIFSRFDGDIFNVDGIENLDYKIIKEFKFVQSDFEAGTGRYINDYNLLEEEYYKNLFFWYKIFNNTHIDMVILDGLVHGMNDDCIPIALAKKNNIQCYSLENTSAYKCAIFDQIKEEYIAKDKIDNVNMDKDKFYMDKKNIVKGEKNFSSLKEIVKSLIYKLDNGLLVCIISALRKRKIFFSPMGINAAKISIYKIILYYINMKYLYKYFVNKSIYPDYRKKYIIYYMHLEPEATIQVRCKLQSQLVAIKMLSKAIPADWKIYVKEHPLQFKLNKINYIYLLFSGFKYKTKKFYDEIIKLGNVEIINPRLSSKELLKNAQAVSTFNGTIALEAIDEKKPILLFGGETTVYQYHNDFLCVDSYKKCKFYIKKIVNSWQPAYENINELFNKYVYERNDDGISDIVENIYRISMNK